MTTQEEINKILKKWEQKIHEPEEYIPTPLQEVIEEPPTYTPSPKDVGPKALTIEEYRRRQQKHKEETKQFRESQPTYTPKKRGGKKRKFEQACADLQRIINISKGAQKKKLIEELKTLKQKGWKN